MSAETMPEDAVRDSSATPAPVLVDPLVLARWLGLLPATDAPAPTDPGHVPEHPHPAPQSVKILDVRWTAAGGSAHPDYLQGHLPSAVYVSLPSQLAGHGAPQAGRHPLPEYEDFAQYVQMWGIENEDTVVVYDDSHGTSAARAWWLLRHAGLQRVHVLDGGLAGWRQEGLPLQSGEVIPRIGQARISWGHMPVVDIDEVAQLPAAGLLLDARAPERYRGEHEPLDPQAGHIPGAVNLPSAAVLGPDGRHRSARELRELVSGLGVQEGTAVAATCGSGVTAAHLVAALEIAGVPAALYPGSFSAWSNTPGRPVSTGDTP